MTKPEVVKEEYILDSKNIKEVPCFIGIMSDLIDKIIQETKEDSFAKRIFDYFSPNTSNLNDMPYRNMNKFKINNNMILYNNLIYIPVCQVGCGAVFISINKYCSNDFN